VQQERFGLDIRWGGGSQPCPEVEAQVLEPIGLGVKMPAVRSHTSHVGHLKCIFLLCKIGL
jgi:hypothetical protein